MYLGLDLGTSSVKALLCAGGEVVAREREGYSGGRLATVKTLCRRLAAGCDLSRLAGMGLSSQVGTYIVESGAGARLAEIPWSAPEGAGELAELLSRYPREVFLRETGMEHPALHSYPLPRLTHIVRRYGGGVRVLQPKDELCRELTGRAASDPYSWRGLWNPATGGYSGYFLRELHMDPATLPELRDPCSPAGRVTPAAAGDFGLPEGVAVYTGTGDFFAALIGAGVSPREGFDITGTSEHVGVPTADLRPSAGLISSPAPGGFVHYGVTAASGASISWGREMFPGEELSPDEIPALLAENPPIFLPYLRGERAPVFDPDARGVFFGITADTSRREMFYSVAEGVAFSVRHICEALGSPAVERVTVCGGLAGDAALNTLKAALLRVPVRPVAEKDSSALGASVIAEAGATGEPPRDVAARYAAYLAPAVPDRALAGALAPRFSVYKRLYPAVKGLFARQ